MKSRHAWLLFSLVLPVAASSAGAQATPAERSDAAAAPAAKAGADAGPGAAKPAPAKAPRAKAPVDKSAPALTPAQPAPTQPKAPPAAAPAQAAPPAAPPPAAPGAPGAQAAAPTGAQPPPLPPPKFRTRAGRVHVFRAPPIKPKRRYGNAGAPFMFGVGASLRFRSDRGYRQLRAGKQQSEFELSAAYDVFQPVRRIVFAAGLDYRYAALGDPDSLQVRTNAVQVDLIARYTLALWLFPYLRAGVGAQLTRIDLDDDVFRAHDRSAGATGSIGAGFTLQTPRRLFETHGGRLASLSFGLLLEGGYAFASAADYKLKIKSSGDLPVARIPLGKLDLGGPYLRILGVLRF